jgi:MFS family permease
VIGPIVGGFVAENPRLGWHFNFWLIFIFSATVLVCGYFVTPETVRRVEPAQMFTQRFFKYAPVLLRRRSRSLSAQSTGTVYYISIHDVNQSQKSFYQTMRTNLSRPFRMFLRSNSFLPELTIELRLFGSLHRH